MRPEEELFQGDYHPPQEPLPPEDQIIKAPDHKTRMEGYRRLLTNFTYSLGAGLSASAQPGIRGRRNRTMAGIGAALTAPIALQKAQQQFELQQASEERMRAQSQQIIDQNNRQELQLPYQLQQIMSAANRNNAAAQGDVAQAGVAGARQGLIEAQTGTEMIQQQRAKYVPTQMGVFDVTTRQIVPGTDTNTYIEVTPELAEELRLSETLVGLKLRATEINQLQEDPTRGVVASTNEGILLINPVDGTTIKRLGSPRPTAAGGVSATSEFNSSQSIARAFDTNVDVRRFVEAAGHYGTVKSLVSGPWSGPADMAIVFEFMRTLDPTSVVRESEYAEARRTGNWFKGVWAQFNGYFNPEGGFLSDQVKKDFLKVLETKIQESATNIKSLYEDFGRRIDEIEGTPGRGKRYLTDYPTVYGITQSAPTRTASPTAPNQAPNPNNEPEFINQNGRIVPNPRFRRQ